MMPLETFSLYVLLCVLAPLVGAFTLSFVMIFERQIDNLQKEASKLTLEKELQNANYDQLNQQIQPHFFFNTLNTMLSLARLDRKDELIKGLEVMAKFFKFKYISHASLIKVEDELSYVNNYLEIQRLRFGERLEVIKTLEEQCEKALLPPFIIQTIVENAFKHGFEKNIGPATLKINIYHSEGFIYIQVWNTHLIEPIPKKQNYTPQDEGYGIVNIQKRLELLFPQQVASLNMIHIENETLVEVKFPLTYFSNGKEDVL
ncbi:histidine kinase [Psychrobacillus sp.]|uniref:sensor histidine kinase n=1 Tax=Psychrobacillus sp. TaxID=1871623 RepID=UPI0028BD779B|nr:histidine kinase [Psychrobacillus sp.]